MRSRWVWLGAIAVSLTIVLFVITRDYSAFNKSLTRGLEEEESYTRRAMEYHREHPDKRKGDLVLEVWSEADYIAQAVEQQGPAGEWAMWSDKLGYLPEKLRTRNGRPFCVIESPPETIVIWYLSAPPTNCDQASSGDAALAGVRSGDLEFSGRQDDWVYVLRRKRN